jgi:hypothetical protein
MALPPGATASRATTVIFDPFRSMLYTSLTGGRRRFVETTVQVAEFPSAEEARLAHGMLVANGIDAVLKLETAGGAYPQLAARVQGGTGVHVPVDQVHEARSLLEGVGHEVAAVPGTAGPDDEAEGEWRGTHRARWAGRVIVALVFVVPLTWAILDAAFS